MGRNFFEGVGFGEFRENIGKEPNQVVEDILLSMIIPEFNFL